MKNIDKSALISGASGKLGSKVIDLLHNLGYNIIGQYNKNPIISDVEIDSFKADFTNLDEVETMMSSIYKKYKNIDVFINMSSIFNSDNLETFNSRKAIDNLAIHSVSPLNIIYFINKNNKSICNVINILDDMIKHETKSHLSYILSKMSLLNITELLSSSYKTPKIRVNAILSKIMYDLYDSSDEIHKLPDVKKESYANVIDKISTLVQDHGANGVII